MFSLGPVESFSTEKSAIEVVQVPMESDVDAPEPSDVAEPGVGAGAPSGSNQSVQSDMVVVDPVVANATLPAQTHSKFRSEMDADAVEALSEPYKAVWFTYDYHDVGPVCSVEECAEVLRIGRMEAVFSPDVVHRLELFKLALEDSLKVTPSVSTGTYVALSVSLSLCKYF